MTIHMQNIDRFTLSEIQQFVKGCARIGLSVQGRAKADGLIQPVLDVQQYQRISTTCKGIVRRFLAKVPS